MCLGTLAYTSSFSNVCAQQFLPTADQGGRLFVGDVLPTEQELLKGIPLYTNAESSEYLSKSFIARLKNMGLGRQAKQYAQTLRILAQARAARFYARQNGQPDPWQNGSYRSSILSQILPALGRFKLKFRRALLPLVFSP